MSSSGVAALGITQGELAGRTTGPSASPKRGDLLRDFTLPSAKGLPVSLSHYRGQANLVLVYTGNNAGILESLAGVQPALAEEQTQVLGVVPGQLNQERKAKDSLPFPVLIDQDGAAHRAAGAESEDGKLYPALYIADRFGEVFGAYREAEGTHLPQMEEIVNLSRFLNIRCEECGHTEWPAE